MKHPVFVVGSPRSGTSALVATLRSAGYHGFGEGNLLGLIDHYNRITRNFFATFASKDPDELMSRLNPDQFLDEVFPVFKHVIERENPVEPWFDKSGNPGVIRMIPVLRKLWPGAKFIFAQRRGIENIVSRRKKFPGYSFEYHCKDWAENMSVWRGIRQSVADLGAIEIDQQAMIRAPDKVAADLASLLDLAPEQQAAVAAALRTQRPQRTAEGTSERVLSLNATDWTQAEKEQFLQLCGEEMQRFGYSFNAQYWKGDSASPESGAGLSEVESERLSRAEGPR